MCRADTHGWTGIAQLCLFSNQPGESVVHSACHLPFSAFSLLAKIVACLLRFLVNSCDHLCGHFAAAFAGVGYQECVWQDTLPRQQVHNAAVVKTLALALALNKTF